MKRLPALALGAVFVVALASHAQENKPKEDPAHAELRALRDGLIKAVNGNDLKALLSLLDDDVIVTWQNGEVSRKPAKVEEYYNRMMKGDKRIVEQLKINPEVAELTHLYGDTGVSFGTSKDHFILTNGMDFEVETRWSATAVKKNGKWLIANFHASTNMFDNPLLNIAKKTAFWAAGIAGVVGLVVGLVVAKLTRKRPVSP